MKNAYFILAIVAIMVLATTGIASAITSPGIPSINFVGTPVAGQEDLSVSFTATAINLTPPLSYEWSFGDGSGATKMIPEITHVYTNPGKYDVTLIVTDYGIGGSQWLSMEKQDYIFVTHVPPVAGFTYTVIGDNPNYNSPVEIQFTSTTTGFEPELLWDFGDHTATTTDMNPVHTFTRDMSVPGSYVVNLTATNDGGSTSHTKSFRINPPKPRADFIATSSTHGKVPLAVQFNDTSIGYGINEWAWDFGDGGTSTVKNPLHAYATVGLYDVTLAATSIWDGSNTTTRYDFVNVTAEADPVICPTPEPTPVPTVCPTPVPVPTVSPVSVGIYKDGTWYLDMNNNGLWDGATTDRLVTSFGMPGWEPVKGDWNGNGITEIGIYKDGVWYLDTNGNGVWGAGDSLYSFGSPGWVPVVGDWTGTGTTRIGIYQAGTWYLDINGDGIWNGLPVDKLVTSFGMPGWVPVPGKWS